MKDFGEVLRDWEGRRGSSDDDNRPKDELPPKTAYPARRVMENAPCDDEIDLHGLTQQEAVDSVRFFLRDSRLSGLKKVRIIHGKGLHSEQRVAVVKQAVQQLLLKDRNVAAWGEAKRRDGGSGASWVWLNALGK